MSASKVLQVKNMAENFTRMLASKIHFTQCLFLVIGSGDAAALRDTLEPYEGTLIKNTF